MEQRVLSNETLLTLLRKASVLGNTLELSRLNLFSDIDDLSIEIVKLILSLFSYDDIRHILPKGSKAIPIEILGDWLRCNNEKKRYVALSSCIGRDDISLAFLEQCFKYVKRDRIGNFETLLKAVEGKEASERRVRSWHDMNDFYLALALAVSVGKKTPLDIIEKGLARSISSSEISKYCGEYAAKVCLGQIVPIHIINDWLDKYGYHYRVAALNACEGRKDIPFDIVKTETSPQRLQKKINDLNRMAMSDSYNLLVKASLSSVELAYIDDFNRTIYAFRHTLSKRQILNLLDHSNYYVVLKVLEICEDVDLNFRIRRRIRDIALDHNNKVNWFRNTPVDSTLLERRSNLRAKATEVCEKRGIKLPLIRDFEPPVLVYLKCANEILAVASIPRDAFVRGEPGGLCVSNKAIILMISDLFFYDKVGISPFRDNPKYFVPELIKTSKFDLCAKPNQRVISDGFYFYCTKDEALNQAPFWIAKSSN